VDSLLLSRTYSSEWNLVGNGLKHILTEFLTHFPKGTVYDLRYVVHRPGHVRTHYTRRKNLALVSCMVPDLKTLRFIKSFLEKSRQSTVIYQGIFIKVMEEISRGHLISARRYRSSKHGRGL
jgi:hypothetical protein